MTTEEIIKKLEHLKVIFTWECPDGTTGKEQMTLKERLLTTCEEGELVSGVWLKENMTDIWDNEEPIFPDHIYCVGTECSYDLGSTYQEAKKELSEGYVSQLSNTQWLEGEDYWETEILD